MLKPSIIRVVAAATLLCCATIVRAQDWGNYGGNSARNGMSPLQGPIAADSLWTNADDFSLISWHPFILGERVFTIRESGFPVDGGAANDAMVAYDLNTGVELWRTTLAFGGDISTEWIAWIGGVNGGKVYVSRSSNLQPGPIQAFDAATGAFLWSSAALTEAWAHDGVVFAGNGDPIVGDRLQVVRIDATDGSTVWSTARSCPVSGNCGVAATDTAVYIDEPDAGGNIITKLDIATGARLYSSTLMPGLTDQNSPFLSPDGNTVYFSRTQNNVDFDFLYAFEDTGAALVEQWNRPVRWTTSHEHGIGPDGSIYTFLEGDEFVRLDPADGSVIDSAGVLGPTAGNLSPKTVVDKNGNVYVSNGWASTPDTDGRLWAFNQDLSVNLFTLVLDRQNAGGPALGGDCVMVVCDRNAVYAYQSPGSWQDEGNGLAGTHGIPALNGSGTLIGGHAIQVELTDALENTIVFLIVGLAAANLPFQGGVMVPSFDLFLLLPTGPAGSFSAATNWPMDVPSGSTTYFQVWLADPGGISGFAASNAISATAP